MSHSCTTEKMYITAAAARKTRAVMDGSARFPADSRTAGSRPTATHWKDRNPKRPHGAEDALWGLNLNPKGGQIC